MTPTPDDIRKAREIPEDIWEKARALRNRCVWASNTSTEIIAQALASEREAERERCAGIAEKHAADTEARCGASEDRRIETFAIYCADYSAANKIAAAIRRSGP